LIVLDAIAPQLPLAKYGKYVAGKPNPGSEHTSKFPVSVRTNKTLPPCTAGEPLIVAVITLVSAVVFL
jgi:hypothetical protein